MTRTSHEVRQTPTEPQDAKNIAVTMHPAFSIVAAALFVLGMSGCSGGGGGDDDEDDGPELPEPSAAGIWSGTYRVDGQAESQSIRGLVTEEGDFMVQSSGPSARLFFAVGGDQNGNTFSANALAYSLTGPGKTPSTLQGTLVERASLNGSYSLGGESATFTLSYQTAYERPASFATLAGVYSSTSTSVAVDANGSFVLNMSNGCMMNGSFQVPTPSRNYYRWSGTLSDCDDRNGPATGIAHLEDAAPGTNNRLRMFGQSNAQTFALVFGLVK